MGFFVSLKAGFQRTFERVNVLYAVTLRQLLFNGCLDISIHYFIAYIGYLPHECVGRNMNNLICNKM